MWVMHATSVVVLAGWRALCERVLISMPHPVLLKTQARQRAGSPMDAV
jgi:hypothetical protein